MRSLSCLFLLFCFPFCSCSQESANYRTPSIPSSHSASPVSKDHLTHPVLSNASNNQKTVSLPLSGNWTLISWSHQHVELPTLSPPYPTLSFKDPKRISGYSSVNRFGGKLSTTAPQHLQISRLFSTRKAGPPLLMNQEHLFLKHLEQATYYVLNNGHLILQNKEKSLTLTFKKTP